MERILPTELRPSSDVAHWDTSADVVVVGLGCAGAAAAIEACDAGADVLVVERAGGGGGAAANSGGLLYLGGGTPVQKACGYDDSPEEMFNFLVAASSPGADEERIRLFCERSVEHFHWLESQGVPFKRGFHPEPGMECPTDDGLVFTGGEDCHPWNRIAQPAPRGHKPRVEGKAGPFFMSCMLEAVTRRAPRLQWNTRCETLVVDPDGRVAGLVVREAGVERAIRAHRGVVLCAGGFALNREMVSRHAPLLAKCALKNATEGDDGRGIRMAQAAGGGLARMDQLEVALPATIPNRLGRGLFVNAAGQRFVNEDTYYGHIGVEALLHQQGRVFLLVDDDIFERNIVGSEPAWVGETVAELEAEARLPEGALQATVALYNHHAARGEDPVFHKRPALVQPLSSPPFALLDCSAPGMIYAGMTLGGVRTSADGEVLTPDGAPVPGLFAAGRTAALFTGGGYAGSGLSLSDGSFFGRRAARAAAGAPD